MKSSKSTKTVVRTYLSKKTGKTVTKTYTYKKSQLRSRKTYIINSKGRINKAALDRLINKGVGTKFELETSLKVQLAQGKVSVSEQRFEASILHNRVEGMFANAGISIDAAASEIGTTEEALYDLNNWNDGVFTDPTTGKSYEFDFNYEGSVWIEVTK